MSASNERLSHLFIVRVWFEPDLAAVGRWRGLVEQLPAGPRCYFASMADLDDFIALRLACSTVGRKLPPLSRKEGY